MTTSQAKSEPKTNVETFEVNGEEVVDKVKDLVEKGGIGKISILTQSGKVIAHFPVTLGLVGVLVAPMLAAVGAIAAVVTKCTIRVERKVERTA